MWAVRIRDRGRDLTVHTVEDRDEAQELCRVYEVLGFAPDRITVERLHETAEPKAA